MALCVLLVHACIARHQTMPGRLTENGLSASAASLPADMLHVQAVSTWTAADGIEQCRRGCGGHGFSALSGLPNLFASYVQNVTWEGDNNVLCLQVGRNHHYPARLLPSTFSCNKGFLSDSR